MPTIEEAPPVEFYPYFELPEQAKADASKIIQAAKMDVAGIEYLETPDGRRVAQATHRPT